jgi:hypothetical protein
MILNKFINFLSKLQKIVNFSGYNIELTISAIKYYIYTYRCLSVYGVESGIKHHKLNTLYYIEL